MSKVKEILTLMKAHWSDPKTAIHRGTEIPFKLCCSLNDGVEESRLSSVDVNFPKEAKELYLTADGAALFKDDEYGQWGLRLFRFDEVDDQTSRYLRERSKDSIAGDRIIGEFTGDSDLLLLRCDPQSNDFGSVIVVSAIDQRTNWDVAAKDLGSFLQKYYTFQGDKYWELTEV